MTPTSETHLQISSLCGHEDWVPVIAQWHHNEWIRSHRGLDVVGRSAEIIDNKLRERENALRQHMGENALPKTLVAHDGEVPVGTVSLVYYQFSVQEKPTEWLTNMFVLPRYRRRGVASALLKAALHYGGEQGLTRVLLYTSDQAPFYEKRGWRVINSGFVQGQRVDIMDRALVGTPDPESAFQRITRVDLP